MLKIDEAIRIAKIIEYAPEDRLPLIVDVFKEAGVNIESLQAAARMKLDTLLDKVAEKFEHCRNDEDGLYKIPTGDFSELAKQVGLEPYQARSALAKRDILQASKDNGKTKYTTPVWMDGKTVRCVVLKLD